MTAALRLSPSVLRDMVSAPGWPRHLVALGALAAAVLLLFWRDVGGMAAIWWTSSTYGHCLFIPFLIGWLVQQRIDMLRRIRPTAWPPTLVWLGMGCFCWLLGDAAGLAVLRHGGVILMLQGAVAAMLGRAATRALLFPLFYAFFLVPVGSELEPALQLLTARIAIVLLDLAGVPAHIEGIFVTIPNGYFRVAEACSGAKFVVAMTAYGVLVCNVCFRSLVRRAIFLTAALALCIFANGGRAFGTIYVAHLCGIETAIGVDHVIYGWVFFALVMIVMMAAAWPFFDRKPGEQRAFDPDTSRAGKVEMPLGSLLAVTLVILIAAPVWSQVSARRGGAELMAPRLPAVPHWQRSSAPMAYPWRPRYDGADHLVQGSYADGRGHAVDVAIVTYARQAEGRELIAFGQGAAPSDSQWSWSSPAQAPNNAMGEQISAPGPVVRHVVTFYRVGGGDLTGEAAVVKLATMKAKLSMQDQRAVAILISAEDREGAAADAAIGAFLHDLGPVEKLADAALHSR